MPSHTVRQVSFLRLVSMFEEFLYHVVPKHILHQLQGIFLKFAEDLVLLFAVGRLELVLDETGAVLISTELDNVAIDLVQFCTLVRLHVTLEKKQLLAHGGVLVHVRIAPRAFGGLHRNEARNGVHEVRRQDLQRPGVRDGILVLIVGP